MTRPPRAQHLWTTYDLPVLHAIARLTPTTSAVPARTLITDTGLTHRQVHAALVRLHDAAYIEARDTGTFDTGYPTREAIRLTPTGVREIEAAEAAAAAETARLAKVSAAAQQVATEVLTAA